MGGHIDFYGDICRYKQSPICTIPHNLTSDFNLLHLLSSSCNTDYGNSLSVQLYRNILPPKTEKDSILLRCHREVIYPHSSRNPVLTTPQSCPRLPRRNQRRIREQTTMDPPRKGSLRKNRLAARKEVPQSREDRDT